MAWLVLSLSHISLLPDILEVFRVMALACAMGLNREKRVIVLVTQMSPHLVECVHSLLTRFIPSWIFLRVPSPAVYVVFSMGPSAGSEQWKLDVSKALCSCKAIASSGLIPSVVAFSYTARVAFPLFL